MHGSNRLALRSRIETPRPSGNWVGALLLQGWITLRFGALRNGLHGLIRCLNIGLPSSTSGLLPEAIGTRQSRLYCRVACPGSRRTTRRLTYPQVAPWRRQSSDSGCNPLSEFHSMTISLHLIVPINRAVCVIARQPKPTANTSSAQPPGLGPYARRSTGLLRFRPGPQP